MINRLSKEDYKILEQADIATDGKVAGVLNRNGCANWTVCPECRVDDFSHSEDCSLNQH
jgi:hypothetical protein